MANDTAERRALEAAPRARELSSGVTQTKARYFAAAAAIAVAAGVVATAAAAIPSYIAAAVANPARPAADTSRDALRKPGEVLAFARIRPGDKVLELIPGGGYFSRLLSGAVGRRGHVTEAIPAFPNAAGDVRRTSPGVAADPHFSNVSEIGMTPEELAKAGPVDVVWTSQNYHDLHLTRLHLDVVGLDKVIYAALRPGGEFFIEDHAASLGSGTSNTDAMHRIDESFVVREVESVGFQLADESDILRNPADAHTLLVFNPTIRGHTDQFLLVFRKPR
jgi:predicted methyltransferase